MNHNYLYGSFSRLSDFPLDDRYLFETREKLNAYLTVTGRMTTTAYEGQLVYIVDEEALCLIQKDDQGGFYPQTITSEAYDDADIRNEIDKIKDFIQNGKYNVIEENGAVAYGVCTIAKDHQFTVGEYNDYDSNAIFTVGNGIEGNRNNAFTVNRDGTATVSEAPKKDQDVATKKYVDDVVANINVDTSDLVSKSELDEAIKDFITIDDIPPQQDIDISNLVTKTELEEAIAGISGSEVTATEFKELSDKVTNLDKTINSVDEYVNDTIVPALNTQSERIVNLDERLVELENATPEIPENIVDEDKLNETLKDYATKSDLVGYIEKALVDSVNLETGKVVINGVEADPLPNIIYLWKDPEATLPDIYNEYTLIGNELILIGDTSTNLSDFYTKGDVDKALDEKAEKKHTHSMSDITDYEAPYVPTKISELTNDSNFAEKSDFNNYYTKTEIDELIEENKGNDVTIPATPVVLDDAVTENSSNGVKSSGIYAFVKDEISKIEHPTPEAPDLSNYATTDYVKQAIAEAELNDKEVDLSSYATVSYVDGKFDSITIPDVPTKVSELENDAEYITADAVPTKISDLENDSKYITLEDIPATDLSDYYTKTQVDGLISDSIPDTSNFITMKDVEDKGYLTEHQDISGKLDVATYAEDKKTFLVANDIKDMATKSDISNLSEVYADKKEFDAQKEIVSKFFSGNAQEAYDELSEIGDAIVELRNQVIDENIAGALVDKVIDIENTRYTKTEVDALLEGKSDVGHKHDEYLTELPEHTHDQYLTELPEHSHDEYLTELPEHTHDQYLTELPEHTHDEYLTELPEHTHSEYTTTSDVNTLIDAKLGQVSIDSIDPEKVIFPNEIKTTYSIGNITVSNGQPTTLVKAGDSLKDFFNIFMTESVGSVTAPSLSSISATGANSAYEVGATITNPVISFVFNDGEYQYGPEPTGCEVSAISATYNGVTKTLSDFTKKGTTYSATFDSVVISKEGNICKLSDLDVSYTAGSAPKSNLGNYIEASKIKAGTINNKNTNYTTGYRPIFYGTFTEVKDDNGEFIRETITTGNIRTKLPNKKNGKVDFTMTVTAGETSAMIAIPSSWGSIKSIKDVIANADILSSFKTSTVEVNGYGENTNYKTNYTLYVFSTAGFGNTTYDVKF